MTRPQATTVGAIAVLLWSLLALLTVWAAPVPPFQLNAMCFFVGSLGGLVWAWWNGGLYQLKNVPLSAYLLGIIGLAGYHLLYFSALRAAPPAEAGLIAYLWPLLIVLFSGLLPGEQLKSGHVLGGCLGFAGAALLIGTNLTGGSAALTGYVLALACAVTWSGYSVLSRRFGKVPTAAVTISCLGAAVVSAIAHHFLEPTVVPSDALTWFAVLALGLGPVGFAFFVWDVGVKHGDIQLLGVLSYAAPILSTLVLVLAGLAEPSLTLWSATALITAGALVAARASQKEERGR